MVIDFIVQTAIIVCGVFSAWLSQDPEFEKRKWSSIAGLIAQPFWFYSTYINDQWGMFAVSFVFLAAYARGFWEHWIKKNRGTEKINHSSLKI